MPTTRPLFPVLSQLSILRLPGDVNQFLSIFYDSPISKLYINGNITMIPDKLALKPFEHLRSFGLSFPWSIMEFEGEHFTNCLSSVCASASPNLQALTLEVSTDGRIGFVDMKSAFADSLVSLTLNGDISTEDVIVLVQQFPRLKWLNLKGTLLEFISSDYGLAGQVSRESKDNELTSVNTSLRFLRAVSLSEYDYFDSYDPPSFVEAKETSLCRGLISDLVCRLPSLDTLQVNESAFEGVKSAIKVLVDTNSAPEYTQTLSRLKIQAVVDWCWLDR
ncbi:hypothetical protein GGI21_004618 [Coemansia aciculifera]|nr:hypothetical protein GGI21_004618 [Coemansia aciculifera]